MNPIPVILDKRDAPIPLFDLLLACCNIFYFKSASCTDIKCTWL